MATILVVDDNRTIAWMLSRFLRAKGHETIVANSGNEALTAALGVPKPDLILLDLSMPEMDGLEVLRRLRSQGPIPSGENGTVSPGSQTGEPHAINPPVVFFSAIDDPDIIASALRQGASDYWVKASFNFDEMPGALERVLSASVFTVDH